MKFVVGIGNPGAEYEGTRHNIGFEAVGKAAGRAKFRKDRALKAEFAELPGAWLVRPLTFVNLTGDAARLLARKKGATPGDWLFVCDDVHLDFGKMRLRAAGSAGGHHGLESVIEALETEDFARLRVGVRTDAMPENLAPFVLRKFSKQEQKRLPQITERAARICGTWIEKGFEAAQRELSRLQSVQDK